MTPKDEPAAASPSSELDLQGTVLRSALAITAIVAPMTSLQIVVAELVAGILTTRTVVLSLYPLLFPVLWMFQKRLGRRGTGFIFIGLMLLMAFILQLRGGLTFVQAVVQLWVLLLAGVVFGVRGVSVALGLSFLGFVLAGFLVLNGVVPAIDLSMWDPRRSSVWFRSGIVFSLFGGSASVAVAYVVARLDDETRKLRESLEREKKQRLALELAEKEKEETRRALTEAQRVQALGQLASGVAHDFNNSLTVIIASADLAELESNVPPRARKSLGAIKNAAMQAAEMTRSLLALARKDPQQLKVVRTGELLNDMSRALKRLLPEDIRFSIVEQTDAPLKIDRTQMERAIVNLVVNARDAIDRDGDIRIGSKESRLEPGEHGLDGGTYIVVWVSDNGHGMTEEVLEHVFEPFYTTKDGERGTGMGMALVRGFVSDAQGAVTVDTTPEKGTTVSLYFPMSEDVARPVVVHTESDRVQTSGSGYKVLVVEDNEDVLASTSDTLRRAGFDVVKALNGDAALQIVKNEDEHFDLMCIDGVIPGASSADVIAAVRNGRPAARIVVCSGYVEEELVVRGIRTGELAYVRKPYLGRELLGCIRGELGLH